MRLGSPDGYPGRTCTEILFRGCGMKCAHCPRRNLLSRSLEDPPWELLRRELERQVSLGVRAVCLCGGEPTARENRAALDRIFGFTGQSDLLVHLRTNGTDPGALARILKDHVVHMVTIHIPGTPDEAARMCGAPRDYLSRVKRAIEAVRKSDARLELATTLTEWHTYEGVRQMGYTYGFPPGTVWRLDWYRRTPFPGSPEPAYEAQRRELAEAAEGLAWKAVFR